MMIIERGNTKVCFCQETLAVTVEKDQTRWEWTDGFQPKLICKEGSFSFLDKKYISCYYTPLGSKSQSIF